MANTFGTGNLNLTGTTPLTPDAISQLTDVFGTTSIAVIALTVFNFLTAILSLGLIIFDNRRKHKTWKVAPSYRIPLSLSIAIALGHLVFIIKAFNGLPIVQMDDVSKAKKLSCKVLNELGFWAIWAPLVTMAVRVVVTVYNAYAIWAEGTSIFFIALVSFLAYLPVRIITPAKQCLPFVLVFLGKDQTALAMSAAIILSVLLVLLVMGLLIIGFDTAMLVRSPPPQRDIADPDSGASYVRAQQKKHPNRKLVYYGSGIILQYMLLLPNFIFGAMGIFNAPTNLLASVALHLDGTVLLFQYLFGHRYNADSCANCEEPWHPDLTDVFHRPYSARVGQWWRRSFIDSRSFITATVTPEPPAVLHSQGQTKFSTTGVKDENDDNDSSDRGISSHSVQHTIRTVELPSIICELPNLSLQVQQRNSGLTMSQWSPTEGSEFSPVTSKNPLRNLLKRTLSSKAQPVTVRSPTRPPLVHRSSLAGRVVYGDTLDPPKLPTIETDSIRSIQTAEEISRIRSSIPMLNHSDQRSSLKSSRRNSGRKGRSEILQNFPPPPPFPPITQDMTEIDRQALNLSHASTPPVSTTPRPSIIVFHNNGSRSPVKSALSKASGSSRRRARLNRSVLPPPLVLEPPEGLRLGGMPAIPSDKTEREPKRSTDNTVLSEDRSQNRLTLTSLPIQKMHQRDISGSGQSSKSQVSDISQRSKIFIPRKEGML